MDLSYRLLCHLFHYITLIPSLYPQHWQTCLSCSSTAFECCSLDRLIFADGFILISCNSSLGRDTDRAPDMGGWEQLLGYHSTGERGGCQHDTGQSRVDCEKVEETIRPQRWLGGWRSDDIGSTARTLEEELIYSGQSTRARRVLFPRCTANGGPDWKSARLDWGNNW